MDRASFTSKVNVQSPWPYSTYTMYVHCTMDMVPCYYMECMGHLQSMIFYVSDLFLEVPVLPQLDLVQKKPYRNLTRGFWIIGTVVPVLNHTDLHAAYVPDGCLNSKQIQIHYGRCLNVHFKRRPTGVVQAKLADGATLDLQGANTNRLKSAYNTGVR